MSSVLTILLNTLMVFAKRWFTSKDTKTAVEASKSEWREQDNNAIQDAAEARNATIIGSYYPDSLRNDKNRLK